MFCKNNSNQINFNDPTLNMPAYLKRILERGWAHHFNRNIFCKINEERFSVLYSENDASRPNSPVNVIISLLILKELFQQTDEELVGSLHFDIRYQYAVGTTSYDKQPISINTLYNFRCRLLEYEMNTGIDLLKDEIEALSSDVATVMGVDNNKIRMDSLMVSSSCKKMSRIELVYTVNRNMIKVIEKYDESILPNEYKEYLKKSHKNDTIYRTKSVDAGSKLEILLTHSIGLFELLKNNSASLIETEEFEILKRMIEEQVETADEQSTPKQGKDIASNSLQNPSDPDATYRKKYGSNIGYTANVAEGFNDKESVILKYDLKPNIYSDSKFSDDIIEELATKIEDDETVKLVVDGAYYEQDKADKAAEKGIELIPTELVGKKPTDGKFSYANFDIDEENGVISRCPAGQEPEVSSFKKGTYTGKFNKETCNKCEHKDKCPFKSQKKNNVIRFTQKRYNTDLQRERMKDSNYIELANKRAGVEGIPSVLRRRYKVDNMPIRGYLRSKLWFGFKIMAYNVKKLLRNIDKGRKKVYKNNKLSLYVNNLLQFFRFKLFCNKIKLIKN